MVAERCLMVWEIVTKRFDVNSGFSLEKIAGNLGLVADL